MNSAGAESQPPPRRSGDLPPVWRLPLLLLAVLALAGGVRAGLARLGWEPAYRFAALTVHHGPLLVGGFLGSVIGLERAVALGRRWGYLAPLLAGAGALALPLGFTPLLAALAHAGAAALLCAMSLRFWQLQPNLANATVVAGAVAWLGGNLAWLGGQPLADVAPWWLAFLVLTVAGERLELSRYLPVGVAARRLFAVLLLLLPGGVLLRHGWPAGDLLAAASLLAAIAWLVRHDIARFSVRRPGLPRFAALAIFNGYAWAALAALAWLAGGGLVPGSLAFDVALHGVFLGFVLSMVFAHAPIVLPAVAGVALPFHVGFYLPLLLLDLSLLLRFAGAAVGLPALRAAGGVGHALALLLFRACVAWALRSGRLAARAATVRPTS
ncbi:MAG TPA: hypothetical protein VIX81_01570 [Gammaproteobacteria bacterium]